MNWSLDSIYTDLPSLNVSSGSTAAHGEAKIVLSPFFLFLFSIYSSDSCLFVPWSRDYAMPVVEETTAKMAWRNVTSSGYYKMRMYTHSICIRQDNSFTFRHQRFLVEGGQSRDYPWVFVFNSNM